MVIIKNKGAYVEIDLTAFKHLKSVDYGLTYLMKDQTYSVRVEKNGEYVEVNTPIGNFQLDQNAVMGLPAMIENVTPLDNFQLGLILANLKNL